MKALSAFVVLVVTMELIACGGGGASQGSSAPAAAPNAAAPAAGSGAPPAGASEYGVPECDEYVKKYEACINSKVPESSRAAVKQGLDASKASFRQAASTAEGRASLATGCRQALDGAKAAMGAYGCTW
jgi:hypothetical protein